MDILNDDVKKLFLRFLFPAFGSAIIASVYSLVDMAMVGQYQGSEGTAALAAIAPLWNIVYSIGLWGGIGGSVLYGAAKGRGEDKEKRNRYFVASLLLTAIVLLLFSVCFVFFRKSLFLFFGANEELLPLCEEYIYPILFVLPSFGLNQLLAAFLRNDDDPTLAMVAVLGGGVSNVFGDYFFVFVCDMGMFGAGLATAIGSLITLSIMLIHFFKKKNTLSLATLEGFFGRSLAIIQNGFSSFFVDFAMGIVTVFFNQQAMRYIGADALAVYGVILNVNTLVQCCAYGVGQAAQPLLSASYGAKKKGRIKLVLRYSLVSIGVISLFWGVFSLSFPSAYTMIFIADSESLLPLSKTAVRLYAIGFFLLPFNVFSTYYFQSILRSLSAFMVSLLRGFLLSVPLIFLLPFLFGGGALWLALPLTELLTATFAIGMSIRYSRMLTKEKAISQEGAPQTDKQ